MDVTAILLWGGAVLFLAGTIKGFVGIGLPTVAMALLTLVFDPRLSVSLILMPMLLSNLWQMWRGPYLLAIARRFWRYAVVLAVAVAATVWISRDVSDAALLLVLGLLVLLFAVATWREIVPDIPPHRARMVEIFAAGFAGIVGGLTAAWAAPLAIYLSAQRLSRDEFVQALGFLISAGSLPLLVMYMAVGHARFENVALSTLLFLPTLAGFAAGERMRRRSEPELFRKVLAVTFFILGLNLLYRAMV